MLNDSQPLAHARGSQKQSTNQEEVLTHENEGHNGRDGDYRGNDLRRRVLDEYALPPSASADAAAHRSPSRQPQRHDNGGIPTNRAAVYIQTELPQFLHATLMTDPAGAVWVQDGGHDKLVKLAVGPDAQTELPLPILGMHGDVHAVDSAGNVYGANGGGVDPNGGCCLAVHVVTQAVGSDTPTVLPFDGIDKPIRVTVDTAGNVYVIDGGHRRVLKLAPAASN